MRRHDLIDSFRKALRGATISDVVEQVLALRAPHSLRHLVRTSCLLVALVTVATAVAGSTRADSDATLPLLLSTNVAPGLSDPVDTKLQLLLEACTSGQPDWTGLIADHKLAVGIVDLADFEHQRLAMINGDVMLYAASLPKIALLLAAEQALEDGTIDDRSELRQDLHDMLRVSSNDAATRTLDCLGYGRIASTLNDPRYRLFDPATNGGLWVGKRYAKEGELKPDPIAGLLHAATVRQVLRYYQLLVSGQLVSPNRSRQMLDALSLPGLPYKFACAFADLAPDAAVYRKSGSWRIWHADSILVWEITGRRYILVGLVEDAGGERILQQLAAVVDDMLTSATARAETRWGR